MPRNGGSGRSAPGPTTPIPFCPPRTHAATEVLASVHIQVAASAERRSVAHEVNAGCA